MTRASTGPITFWFDFGSPYAWLASTQVETVARRCGRAVRWRAILLGVIFRTTGAVPLSELRLRGDYARRDLARHARRLGLPFATATPPPGTSLALARVFHAIALRDTGLAARFTAESFMAVFAGGEALDEPGAAQAFAARLGPAAEAAAAAEALSPAARGAARCDGGGAGRGRLRRALLHGGRGALLGPGPTADAGGLAARGAMVGARSIPPPPLRRSAGCRCRRCASSRRPAGLAAPIEAAAWLRWTPGAVSRGSTRDPACTR